MTDKKTTQLTQAIPVGNDIMPYVSSPSASPVTKNTLYDNGGWIGGLGTWSYSSADSPSFVISINADVTGYVGLGYRIKLTQTTAKYFIVTKVGTYTAGATLITVYGGTDYTLANAAITSPYYSNNKSPFGFPLLQSKWTVEVTDSTTRSQASPTSGTWYNLNNTSISAPIGVWNHVTSVLATVERAAAGNLDIYVTLSTANNSASDATSTRKIAARAASVYLECSLLSASILNLTSKTTYYLNTKADATTVSTIYNNNGAQALSIRLICAYL